MNQSTAIFLVDDHVRAIKASYDDTDNGKVIKTFKTLDTNIKVDDFVVVPTHTRHKMTVCKVVEVDVDVDFDSNEEVKWVVASVDKTQHDQIVKQEEVAIKKIRSAEVNKKKMDLLNAMKLDPTTIPALTFNSNSATVATDTNNQNQ